MVNAWKLRSLKHSATDYFKRSISKDQVDDLSMFPARLAIRLSYLGQCPNIKSSLQDWQFPFECLVSVVSLDVSVVMW